MIAVSDAWKEIHQRSLLPEAHIEITCAVTETGAQETASISATSEAVFSRADNCVSITDTTVNPSYYATLEHNLWCLDGTRNISPNNEPYANVGYVSEDDTAPTITMSLPSVRTATIPGITIQWSSEYDEYATSFTVTAKNGETVKSVYTVENNTSNKVYVDMELSDYDTIEIEVLAWSLPNHRIRLDMFALGHILVYTKKDILNFTHEQSGCLNSGELPKNSITFSLDNTDDRWNPINPNGMSQYLAERQKITVKYGYTVGDSIEWIKAGTFYLSEWDTPSNGIVATFTARDILEFILEKDYKTEITGTLKEIVESVFSSNEITSDFVLYIDDSLADYSTNFSGDEGYKSTEVLQMCANTTTSVIYQDREGVLHIEPMKLVHSGYTIPLSLSYSQPEITLSKPLAAVSVRYPSVTSGNVGLIWRIANEGETESIDNPLTTASRGEMIAKWTVDTLASRKTLSGEFRADPRLDIFDVVDVESKYGVITPVVITNVKYTYSGAFKATYKGRLLYGETAESITREG